MNVMPDQISSRYLRGNPRILLLWEAKLCLELNSHHQTLFVRIYTYLGPLGRLCLRLFVRQLVRIQSHALEMLERCK
jgi:hypothetical protein